MSKTNMDKKVNRYIKKVNKDLENDVFKDRFWLRQYQKGRADGMEYYLYELCDRLEPERNRVVKHWLNGCEALGYYLMRELNDFIITSDFWKLYWEERDMNKNKELNV